MKNKKKPSILIVDPDVHTRELVSDFLADEGFALRLFNDGYTALDHARQHPPALVIAEILVPKLDGLALSRLVKGDSALQCTKIMILSMLAAEDRARDAGADAFMRKPVERKLLTRHVQLLVRPAAKGDHA